VLPGGVNSPVRAMRAIGRDPIFVSRGAGARLEDVDGNQYVDWVCSWGPLIAGHAHPAVLDALAVAAADGTSLRAPTEPEVTPAAEVAKVRAHLPGCAACTPIAAATLSDIPWRMKSSSRSGSAPERSRTWATSWA